MQKVLKITCIFILLHLVSADMDSTEIKLKYRESKNNRVVFHTFFIQKTPNGLSTAWSRITMNL